MVKRDDLSPLAGLNLIVGGSCQRTCQQMRLPTFAGPILSPSRLASVRSLRSLRADNLQVPAGEESQLVPAMIGLFHPAQLAFAVRLPKLSDIAGVVRVIDSEVNRYNAYLAQDVIGTSVSLTQSDA